MKIFVDIDNTICLTSGNDYENSVPIHENIKKINDLFDQGNTIVYWTSRGGTSGIDWRLPTQRQLAAWNCKYHELRLDKPGYDFFVDDRTLRIEEL